MVDRNAIDGESSAARRTSPDAAAIDAQSRNLLQAGGTAEASGIGVSRDDAAIDAAVTGSSFPSTVDRTWADGVTGDWYDASDYNSTYPAGGAAPAGAPQPGDVVTIGSGTVTLDGTEAADAGTFNANTANLGADGPATLIAQGATIAPSFHIVAQGSASLLAQGTSTFDGTVAIGAGTMTLGSAAGGDLILGASFATAVPPVSTSGPRNLTLVGNVTLDGTGTFALPQNSPITLTNNADVTLVGTSDFANANYFSAGIGGTGTFNLGLAADFETSGPVGSGQTINFASPGAALGIGDVADFQAHITNFASGDAIALTNVAYDASGTMTASYDAATSTLTVTDGNDTVASLGHVSAQNAPLYVVQDQRDGAGNGIAIEYAPPPATGLSGTNAIYARVDPQADIQGSDLAMRSNVVRATDTVPGTTTPIDGTGVKIGIISNSFDNTGTASANEAAGFLPDVKVLEENPSGNGDDEGQAMAEEVHQVAPGAQIDFCASDNGSTSENQQTFAQAVQALQQDGCKVIVDDISMPTGPRYQDAGPTDQAVENAVAANIDYFTATGNEGQAFLNQTIDAAPATINTAAGPQQETAQIFDNGTPYERFTAPAISSNQSDTLSLQWNSPYLQGGSYSPTAAQPLTLQLFDSNGNPVANAAPQLVEVDGQNASVETIALPRSTTSQSYYFAVEQNAIGATAPTAFNATLLLGGGGSGPGGVIDDPQAGMGSDVVGAKLLPNVNSVGEVFYGESAAFGQQPTANIAASSYGGGSQIDYAPDGTPMYSPQTFDKPNFSAPTGTVTTIPGNFANGFFGTSAAAPNAAAVAALMLQANPNLTTSQITQLLEQSAIPFGDPDESGAGLIQADKAVDLAIAVCFASGTRILTAKGEIAVEHLAVGDTVITAAGAKRTVRWLGHRVLDCRRHPQPDDILPVRIRAGAFAPGRPVRDLRISPGHALCVDVIGEVLIPAHALVNGATIVREDVETVTYWHVELQTHDILLAENMPAESYLEMGNRAFFAEADVVAFDASPDAPVTGRNGFCRPFHEEGPVVAFVQERLRTRAIALGWALEHDAFAGLHLVVDGCRVEARTRGLAACFHVPAGANTVCLESKTSVPAQVGAGPDRRVLGVCLGHLVVDDGFGSPRMITADDPLLATGFHDIEDGPRRWTGGRARLPSALWEGCQGDTILRVELAVPSVPRWIASTDVSLASRTRQSSSGNR